MAQPVTRTVARWVATQRTAVSLAIIVATLAHVIPYGDRLPGLGDAPSRAIDILQSVVGLAVVVGLVVDLAHPLGRQKYARWAYLLATFLWAGTGAYFLLVGGIIGWSFAAAQALTALAWAALCLYEWRRIDLAPRLQEVEDR